MLSRLSLRGRPAHWETLRSRKDYVFRGWGKDQSVLAVAQSPATAPAVARKASGLSCEVPTGWGEERT